MSAPTTTSHERELDAHLLRVVAVLAECDPRSVQRHLRGEPIRSSVALRIVRALNRLEQVGTLKPTS